MQLNKHQTRIVAVATSAILGTFVSVIVYLVVQPPKFVRFHGQPIKSSANSLMVLQSGAPKRVASMSRSSTEVTINVSSPKEIPLNKSPNVELTFDENSITFIPNSPLLDFPQSGVYETDIITTEGIYRKYKGNYPGGGATLTSKTFDISPHNRREKPIGVDIPTKLRWTITPKKEGHHKLELDISELVSKETEDWSVSKTVRLNGIELEDTILDEIVIPVTVYTIWGISERMFGVIKALIGLIAFIFTYPIFVLILKRRFGMQNENA